MWLFENLTNPGVRFHLLVGDNYQVGRKDCRIVISKDQSVSRKHAALRVNHPEGNLSKPSAPSTVTLQDSSKYGTLVNGSMMQLGSSVTLKDGDMVTFGAMNTNKWRLTYKPLVAAFSAIHSSEKKTLKALILKLGGHVVSEWSRECTHLVMTQLSVTIKVTGALLSCRPIVTPQYLHSLKEAAQNDKDMPDTTNFRPTVIEEAIDTKEVNFDPNPVRSVLFRDKTFMFVASKQYKQLGPTIQLGGGRVILMEEGDKDALSMITNSDSIVMYADPEDSMQAATQDTQEWIRHVMTHLKRNGLRPIPVSELGLAVLYASTQLHCNPQVAQAGLNLLNALPSQTATQPQVLVSDTQASCSNTGQRSTTLQAKVTGSSSEDERKAAQGSKKRMRQDSIPQMSSKVPKLEPPSPAPPAGRPQPSKPQVAETPQKSSESLQSGSNIKTSPEFSFVGATESRQAQAIKKELVSPPTERNNNKTEKVMVGQKSEVVIDDEENMDMGSDHEESAPASVKEEINVSVSNRDENVQSGNSKKKNKMSTLDSLWDIGGSTRQKKRMKEEAQKAEEVRKEEEVDVKTDALAGEEDSQNSMWKKKRKRNVLDEIEADEARESQLSQDPEEPAISSAPSDTPSGFFTAARPPKEEPKTEPKEEPQASKVDPPPYAVVCIEESSLVIRRPKPRPTNNAPAIGRTHVKNFKKFRKAGYAGQNGMPRIIGGRDLVEHSNKPNDDIDDMMFGGLQAEQRKNREEEEAEKLFADEPRARKGRRR